MRWISAVGPTSATWTWRSEGRLSPKASSTSASTAAFVLYLVTLSVQRNAGAESWLSTLLTQDNLGPWTRGTRTWRLRDAFVRGLFISSTRTMSFTLSIGTLLGSRSGGANSCRGSYHRRALPASPLDLTQPRSSRRQHCDALHPLPVYSSRVPRSSSCVHASIHCPALVRATCAPSN